MNVPRGVRNCNPGNIDYNQANKWQGQMPPNPILEKRFARFDSPENGIRALGKLLQTYQTKYGLNTVEAIINRWAPASENDTRSYIRAVEQLTGTAPNARVSMTNPTVLMGFVKAIIHHENAGFEYPDLIVREGVRRALA